MISGFKQLLANVTHDELSKSTANLQKELFQISKWQPSKILTPPVNPLTKLSRGRNHYVTGL